FFQAEDGIRDYKVTGVQTCALPIFRRKRALMSSSINASRQSANHGQPRVSKLVGELLGRFHPVMRGASCPDDANRVMIALVEFAPDVEHNRRRMDLA